MAGCLLADISRLGPENEFSDVVITAGDHRREAHSLILAARSAVFRRMLSSQMLEGQPENGKRHVHLQDMPASTLDQVLNWCYADSAENLDMAESMDLLMAADRLEIPGLLLRVSQRLSKMLTADVLPQALQLAQSLSCAALWQCLATAVARSPAALPGIPELPEAMQQMVRQERRVILERQVGGLRERLAMVPAPRPAIIFWRQRLSEADQRELVETALSLEGGVAALFHGVREKLPGFVKEACQRRWEALDAPTKAGFEQLATEDAEKSESARLRLTKELEDVRHELKLLAG